MEVCEAVGDILDWRDDVVRRSAFSCTPVPFSASREWNFEDGSLRHRSGGFFAVGGIATEARGGDLDGREQLILLQPRPAIIGFLVRGEPGGRELLFQGRVEPGNVGVMQLAPTVQSTEANYQRRHGGGETRFIEWFTQPHGGRRLLDQLQAEEGSRYYGKYNRNVAVALPRGAVVPAPPSFRWLPAETIGRLATADNLLNTDARSALATIDWDELAGPGGAFARHEAGTFGAALRESYRAPGGDGPIETLRWLADLRARYAVRHRVVPLEALRNWVVEEDAIRERGRTAGFSVRQFAISACGREVPSWDQPLVDSSGPGRIVLVAQRRGGLLRFLVKASQEIGFLEGVQLSASVVVQPGQDAGGLSPFERELLQRIDEGGHAAVHARCRQSEEGGRFYQDENAYAIVELADHVRAPDGTHRWLTLQDLRRLIEIPGVVAIELRCAMSLLLSWL